MHEQLERFFALHDAETRQHRQAAKDQMVPVVEIGDQIESHLRQLEARLRVAEITASEADGLEHNLHHLYRHIQMARAKAVEFQNAARALHKSLSMMGDQIDLGKANIQNLVRQRSGAQSETPVAS